VHTLAHLLKEVQAEGERQGHRERDQRRHQHDKHYELSVAHSWQGIEFTIVSW